MRGTVPNSSVWRRSFHLHNFTFLLFIEKIFVQDWEDVKESRLAAVNKLLVVICGDYLHCVSPLHIWMSRSP